MGRSFTWFTLIPGYSKQMKLLADQRRRVRLFIFLLIATRAVRAEVANIAVASNFSHALHLIADDFMCKTRHQLLISSASTGKLYTEIKHSALFDIFLAADEIRLDRLTFRKVTLLRVYQELMRLANWYLFRISNRKKPV